MSFNLPKEAVGFSLCVLRPVKGGAERLDITDIVTFTNGYSAVDTIFRRAEICGWVGKYGHPVSDGNWFADIADEDGNTLDVVPLSRGAWNYLKRTTKARIAREPTRVVDMIGGGSEHG